MRYLHPIAPHETFVAQGRYRYFEDDNLLPIDEQWTIHELKGGALLVRVDEDARRQDGLSVMTEALYNEQHQLERFNVVSDNPQDAAVDHFKADYAFMRDYVQVGRRIAHASHDYQEYKRLPDALIYIRQTIFLGYLIRDILQQGGKSHVFAPQIFSYEACEMLRLQVVRHDEQTIMLGQRAVQTTRYQIADDMFYWVDTNHIVIQRQYHHDGKTYRVSVSDYAHRP